ncbi:MAG: hypothetical protein U0572_18215 [Phycisphaerales bacterium]
MDDRDRSMARWATLVIVAVAVARMMVALQPQVRFDTDPAINPAAFAGIGPAGSFALDVALFLGAALAFVAERRRGIHGWIVLCALLPALPVFWHGLSDAGDFFRGATWLAAAFAAAASAHLARDASLRRLLLAGCVAVTLPLALRGFEQILIDHRHTVEFFEQHKADMLAERGWTPDGAAAQMFERRLRQVEAGGWFGLANLFSAAMAFGTLTLVGLGLREPRSRAGVAALVGGAACAILVAVNGSKGTIVATLLGAAVFVVARRRPSLATACALGAVALAALAPALRGLAPESFAGERSLLFRFQYLRGAIAALPESLPFGLGPDGFQNAYLRLKPHRSPEDVASAHAMVVDWILLLGPLAISWVVLVVGAFLARDARGGATDDADATIEESGPLAIRAGVMVAAIVFALQAIADQSVADGTWIAFRAIGAVALVAGFAIADRLLRFPFAMAVVLAALTAVFAQAQIEMILFQPGMPVWAMVALGASMALPAQDSERSSGAAWSAALAGCVLAAGVAIFGLVPQVRQDRLLDEAAQTVACIADVRELWPNAAREIASGRLGAAAQRLIGVVREAGNVEQESAVRAAMTAGNDANARLSASMQALQRFDANQRARAADILQQADAAYPQNRVALEAAVKQLAAAGRRTLGPRRAEIVEPMLHASAIEIAMLGADRFGGARFPAMLADLWLERARTLHDEVTFAAAAKALRTAIERQPRAARFHADLADLLAASGDLAGAIDEYRASLAIDRDLELDPLARFSDRQRADIESRLASVEAAKSGGAALPAGWPFVAR